MKNAIPGGIIVLMLVALSIWKILANDSCVIAKEYEPIYLIGERLKGGWIESLQRFVIS